MKRKGVKLGRMGGVRETARGQNKKEQQERDKSSKAAQM